MTELQRVLLVSQDFPPEIGGIQSWSHSIAAGLSDLCGTAVLAPSRKGSQHFDTGQPYEVRRRWTPHTSAFGAAACLSVPAAALRFGARAVLHAQYGSAPGSYMAKRAGLIDGYFVAAHAREIVREHLGAPQRRWRRSLLENASGVFAVSRYTAGLVVELGIPAGRIHVVNNGVDLDVFRPRGRSESLERLGLTDLKDRKVILTASRLIRRKGIDDSLRAFGSLCDEHPDWVYLVVGDGPMRGTLETIRPDLVSEGRIRFQGRVPFGDLVHYYSLADLFAMPGREEPGGDVEGFGLVFLEAGACGTAVLGADSGGISDAVIDGENGLLARPGDVRDLGEKMGRLLEDGDLRARLAAGGIELSGRFTWERAARRIFDTMAATIGGEAGGAR